MAKLKVAIEAADRVEKMVLEIMPKLRIAKANSAEASSALEALIVHKDALRKEQDIMTDAISLCVDEEGGNATCSWVISAPLLCLFLLGLSLLNLCENRS